MTSLNKTYTLELTLDELVELRDFIEHNNADVKFKRPLKEMNKLLAEHDSSIKGTSSLSFPPYK